RRRLVRWREARLGRGRRRRRRGVRGQRDRPGLRMLRTAVPLPELEPHYMVELRDTRPARVDIAARQRGVDGADPQHPHLLATAVEPTHAGAPGVAVVGERRQRPTVPPGKAVDHGRGRGEVHRAPPPADGIRVAPRSVPPFSYFPPSTVTECVGTHHSRPPPRGRRKATTDGFRHRSLAPPENSVFSPTSIRIPSEPDSSSRTTVPNSPAS